MSTVPADLKYSKEHEWVRMEDKTTAVIGITDHAQGQLGDIVFVELPKLGAEAKALKSLGVVESVKAASDVYSPLSGKVIAVNAELAKSPEAINTDCYGAGWMVKLEISAPGELDQLLNADAYTHLLASGA